MRLASLTQIIQGTSLRSVALGTSHDTDTVRQKTAENFGMRRHLA